MIDGAVNHIGWEDDDTLIEGDPWLQHPDGTIVELEQHMSALPGGCEDCHGGFFAPTGNGPTEQGIERCDICDAYVGDLEAALALASLLSTATHTAITVWYLPDDDTNPEDL